MYLQHRHTEVPEVLLCHQQMYAVLKSTASNGLWSLHKISGLYHLSKITWWLQEGFSGHKLDWWSPKSVCWIQHFPRFSSFYHQFFQDSSEEISPIGNYCKKGTIFARLHMLKKHLNFLNRFFFFTVLVLIYPTTDFWWNRHSGQASKAGLSKTMDLKYSLIFVFICYNSEKQIFSQLFPFLLCHQI